MRPLVPYELNFARSWQNILMKESDKNSKLQAPKNKQIPIDQIPNSKHKPNWFELLKWRSSFVKCGCSSLQRGDGGETVEGKVNFGVIIEKDRDAVLFV